MTACTRACCWTPFSCGKSYECPCHAAEKSLQAERNELKTASRITYRDPVPNQALYNIGREQNKGRRT